MTTLLLLRRDAAALRRTQADIETTRDLHVVGAVSTLAEARACLARATPDVLLTDLSLNDGAAISLLVPLRRQPSTQERPKVMLIAATPADVLLFGSVSAGADSFIVESAASASLPAAVRRMAQGEAAMTSPLAAQVLGFFGVTARASATINERTLDWESGARDPLRLSRGEQHLLALLAQGEPVSGVAGRLALSIESVGRRLSNVYRKLQWDLRSGSLQLHAG